MTDLSRIKPSHTARASYIYRSGSRARHDSPIFRFRCLREELEEEHRQLVIETLARLMVSAVRTGKPQETPND
jgi:hypothetical protein